jgi:uncharacterized protein (TIGR02646 family)
MYRHPEVRDKLVQVFQGKCAYCETPVGAVSPGDVEHHRPKLGALNLDGQVSPEHYWWLACDWRNLLLVCMSCNRSKRTRFPVRSERAAPNAAGRALEHEEPLLLDPCADQPAKHLVYAENGSVAPLSDRGEVTIDVLALNRDFLVEERWRALRQLEIELDVLLAQGDQSMVKMLRALVAPDRPFAAIRRQFAATWLQTEARHRLTATLASSIQQAVQALAPAVTPQVQKRAEVRRGKRAAIKQSYSVEADLEEHVEAFFAGKKWIEWIELEDFKAIDRLHLAFPAPQSDREPWLMLLGENGTGKSSVLQAVALALMGERHAAGLGLDASKFVRSDSRRGWGRVRVKLATIPEPITVRFTRKSRAFRFETAEPKVLLLAYGATRILRLPTGTADAGTSYIRIKNLFDPTAPLSDVESWLLDRTAVDEKMFRRVTAALKDLLLLAPEDTFERTGERVEVRLRGGGPVGLDQLSVGFQSVVALAVDVMKSLLERFPTVEDAEGIVLLDELEAHLHPSWKIQIVERLRLTFPRVAFLVSTHDPLCLKGLHEGEIVVLRWGDDGHIVPTVDVPPVNDLRADQILTSPLFGLATTRGDDAVAAIARYSDLIDKPDLRPGEKQELHELKDRVEETLTTQESPAQKRVERSLVEALAGAAPAAVEALRQKEGQTSGVELELRRQLDDLLRVPQ